MPWRTWASTASALPRQASARPGASPTTPAPKGGRRTAGSTSSWTFPSSSEESVEHAARGLEAAIVEYPDVAAGVLDQLLSLQRRSGFGHSDPAHAEHVREEFVRHAELVRAHAIPRHQQPAREARFHHVEAVAGGRLRDLLHQRMDIAVDGALQRRVAGKLAPKGGRAQT